MIDGASASLAATGVLLVACLAAFACAAAGGESYYVSPEGDDAWSGRAPAPKRRRKDGPFGTLLRAAEAAGPGDAVYVREGVYAETLRPARSGEAGKPVTFAGYEGERPVITGADPVTGWRREGGGVYSAAVEWDLGHENQVFAGPEMLTEARWPTNAGTLLRPTRARVRSGTASTITDPDLPGGVDLTGALVWCAGGSEWICWSARVTAHDRATHTLTIDLKQKGNWYRPRKGNPYVVMGLRALLDAEGEWWFDREARRLHVKTPGGGDPAGLAIEMKRRRYAIDLAGRSHVRLVGLDFRAAGLCTDGDSSDIALEGLKGEYVGHSYEKDVSGSASVLVRGRRIAVTNSEFAYASGSVVSVDGSDNRIVNCHIHDGNYGAKWRGTVGVAGRRQVIAYNTIRHSGRDLVNVHGLSESLVAHNDLSEAGWLTSDLGMTYGHDTDFAGTVFRHNLVHDNRAPHCAMGIYFDHLSHNAIVHHNVVWNVGHDPLRINNPSYYNLVLHNTCLKSGGTSTFDHSRRQDMFGSRYQNNLVHSPISLPGHVAVENNVVTKQPALADPAGRDFSPGDGSPARGAGAVIEGVTRPGDGANPDAGALQRGEAPWRVGHDFERPPPQVALRRPRVAWMNVVRNACFEFAPTEDGGIEHWKRTGAGKATLVAGNGWGNNWGGGKPEPTGTSKRELRLGGGRDGVEQAVSGLGPRARHRLSAWLKVSDGNESVSLGVRRAGLEDATAATGSTRWVRLSVEFTTRPGETEVVVFLAKTSGGDGYAWCDNVGLPFAPGPK